MATKYVVPTIEVIDSRIADWKIKLVDTVADNGSSAKVVVGNKYSTIEQSDLRTTSMLLYKNKELVVTGAGAAASWTSGTCGCMAGKRKLSDFDICLKAGELILPGALSSSVPVASGDVDKSRIRFSWF